MTGASSLLLGGGATAVGSDLLGGSTPAPRSFWNVGHPEVMSSFNPSVGAKSPVHSSMAAAIFGIWALMTAVAVVDVVNPAKGLLAGQEQWREHRRPESADGLATSRDHPAIGSGWSARGVLSKVSHWNQNALADSPRRQALSGYQIIQRTLAEGEHLRGFSPAQEKLFLRANCRFLVGIQLSTRRRFHGELFTFPTC
jgi:hypothetical protein